MSPADLLTPQIFDGIERPYRVEDHIPRNHQKRPYILLLDEDGNPTRKQTTYTRVTTFIEGIEGERERLNRWKLVQTLKGYTLSPSIHAARLAAVFGATDEAARVDEIIEEMQHMARAQERALLGTAIHALTERHDHGVPTPIFPDVYRPHLQAWIGLTSPWQPFEPWQIERFMVNDRLGVAGTPDRLLRMHRPCHLCGRIIRVGDLKTGRVDSFTLREVEMQLAIYANSVIYDPETGRRIELGICTCIGYVFKIPAVDLGLENVVPELLELNLGRGWGLASQLMPQIREARRYKPQPRSLDPVAFVAGEQIALQLEAATQVSDLIRTWEVAGSYWTEEHTEIASRRRREFEGNETTGGTTT